jgi:hypothetical protein
MLQRRFTLPLIALVSLLFLGLGMRAEADYGVESKRPLSDPHQASIDDCPVGTWRAVIQEKTYFLHVGTGNIVGQSNWMELVLVNPGDKPTFYLHHKVGFPTTIGKMGFFNVANMSVLISQLRGSTTEKLVSSVERYDILKYEVTEEYLDVSPADQKVVRAAIEAGEVKGIDATVDDTAENLTRFIETSAAKLFPNKIRYTRVK